MKNKRKALLLLIFLVPLIVIFSQCFNASGSTEDVRGPAYAGGASCMKCHKEAYNTYIHTAHAQSTRLASVKTIHGSFNGDSNTFHFQNELKVIMEKRASGLYQVGYINNKPTQAQKFDITFGGIKAETYLYWKGNKLFQLPISYFNQLHSWTNSPGYAVNEIDFNRPVGKRCFECHASYIKELPQQDQSLQRLEELDKNAMILGIDCERCHGPAANHVEFHTDYPEQKKARYITKYSELTRAQKIDMCAVCHSGNQGSMLRSTFGFKPGDTLSKFKEPEFYHDNTDPSNLDVHGNQTQMLAGSKCYVSSKMDCVTCHNTHTTQRGNNVLYTQKCMSCHSTANRNFCKMANRLDAGILMNNCINCHMPAKPSNVIVVQTSGKGVANPYMVRSHRIAVYPDETKRILTYLNTTIKSTSK
jgi:hypothetical protein